MLNIDSILGHLPLQTDTQKSHLVDHESLDH
jgi:hypothetical protein